MKIKELRNYLNNLSEKLDDKEVLVRSENGESLPANIKIVIKDRYAPLDHSADNIKSFFMAWE